MKKILKSTALLLVGGVLGVSGMTFLPQLISGHTSNQPYANEQGRKISTLSANDISQLEAGSGWGLAKPAEFNGYPGPAHVIELADKLALSSSQRTAVDASFSTMQTMAKALGKDLIAAEAALDKAFVDKTIDAAKLKHLLSTAATARAKLRKVHLAAHLEVTPLLSTEQKTKYAQLRGYGSGHNSHNGSH